MSSSWAALAAGCAAVVVAGLLWGCDSRQTGDAGGEKRPGAATSKRALEKLVYKVKQPGEFVALADKARRLQGVRAKGVMEMKGPKDIPARAAFEVWTTPAASKLVAARGRDTETIVYDGKYAYAFSQWWSGGRRGTRRKVTEETYYDRLGEATLHCDAARGYTNLGNFAAFRPIAPDEEHGKRVPGLKWFRVVPATKPSAHEFLRHVVTLKVGLNGDDGLVRVMVAEVSRFSLPAGEDARIRGTVIFAPVRHGAVNPADLKLPPEAAQAEWRDLDSDTEMEPPKALIAPAAGSRPRAGSDVKAPRKLGGEVHPTFLANLRKASGREE